MFLTWGTYPLGLFCHSFMLGWLIKAVVTKYGGGREAYHKAGRFMYGVIAGDLLGGLIFMIVGAVYYYLTGDQPLHYMVFPG